MGEVQRYKIATALHNAWQVWGTGQGDGYGVGKEEQDQKEFLRIKKRFHQKSNDLRK